LKNKHKQEFHKRGKVRGDNSPFAITIDLPSSQPRNSNCKNLALKIETKSRRREEKRLIGRVISVIIKICSLFSFDRGGFHFDQGVIKREISTVLRLSQQSL
jgi:hypothetical protein